MAFSGGIWRLWGPHTSAYKDDGDTPLSDTYDSTTRMLYFICNWFQVEYAEEIGQPLTLNRADAIVNEVRSYLDGLKAMGAMLQADVEFEQVQSIGDLIIKGEFSFYSKVTPASPLRAAVLTVAFNADTSKLSQEGSTDQ